MSDDAIPVLKNPMYTIGKVLGKGGGGAVYKAYNKNLEINVVIKALFSARAVKQERDALSEVKSPYLPKVYDFFIEDGTAYTVMELVEGESFDKLLAAGTKFTQAQAVKWYGQLASALEVLHKHDICHRDIKPANIMHLPNDDVCLIDFNVATVSGNDENQIAKSLGYSSPEQNELFEASRRTPSRGTQSSSIKPGSQQTTRPVNGGKPMSQTTEPARGAKPSSQTTEPVRGTRKPSSQTTEPIYRRRADQDTVLEGSGKPIWDQTTQIEGDQETQLDSSSDGEYQDTELYDSEKETEVDSSRKPKTPAYRPPTSAPTAPTAPSDNYGVPEIDWRLSDIYSLGVTIFHIATGERPPKVPQDKSLFKKRGKFSEGFVYVVDQSTKYYPRDRFPSATVLVQAISNIYRYDNSYKRYHARQVAAGLIIPLAFAAFGASAAFGSFTMAQEKEEVFFSQVYEIETAADPEEPYNVALAMNENRIDPYLAMAKRLWSDGDLGACRDYIEANIARIAEFQDSPTEEAKFGDIYIILGNCYYYQSSDYAAARATFEIAVSRIKDNAALYRDYGISLARLGLIPDAERAIEKAQVLGLESDSLNLLNGELAYAKNDYESALGYFEKAAVSTDSYTAFRAIMTTDDIYKALGQPADSVAVLEGSFTRIPAAMIPQMTERLAIAYQQSGDYTNAIRLFEELVKNGIPQFNIMNSLGVLLQYNKEYDRSAEVFEKMATEFPNDYRVPMRQALMTADRQSQLDNDSRDYSKVKEHYDKAASLYAANVKPGQTDPEMQQLEVIMEQLRIGNWIE